MFSGIISETLGANKEQKVFGMCLQELFPKLCEWFSDFINCFFFLLLLAPAHRIGTMEK